VQAGNKRGAVIKKNEFGLKEAVEASGPCRSDKGRLIEIIQLGSDHKMGQHGPID